MGKLTPKQKAFCDYYIITMNATEAAIKAGYSKKTAKVIGSENLSKPYLKQYIDERMKEIEDKRIASIKEVMEFYSSVMRGEIKDQFDLDASLQDRIKAATELVKRYSNVEELKLKERKLELEESRTIKENNEKDSLLEKMIEGLTEGLKNV